MVWLENVCIHTEISTLTAEYGFLVTEFSKTIQYKINNKHDKKIALCKWEGLKQLYDCSEKQLLCWCSFHNEYNALCSTDWRRPSPQLLVSSPNLPIFMKPAFTYLIAASTKVFPLDGLAGTVGIS